MATQITNLTNFADQLTILQLPNGSQASMELIYQGATERWCGIFIYGEFNSGLIGICCLPNVLRQWEETIPFGVAFTTNDQTDPFDINDFSTGRVSVFLLTPADIAELNSSVFGGPQI